MAKQRTRTSTAAPRRAGTPAVARPVPELPVWLAPLVYAAVTVLLFREFFFGGISMLGLDSLALSYFARNFYTEFVQQFHRMPHWNPLLFGGLPFVEGMHGDIFYPPSLAMFFLDARAMWGWKMSLHIFLAGIFTYLFLRRGLLLSRAAAFFGGLVFMMGANMVSLVLPGGDGKLFVSALAPLMFWLAERAARHNRLQDYAVFALGLALLLFTSHMQAAYYCVWGVGLYFLFRAWQLGRLEAAVGRSAARAVGLRTVLFALAGVLGVAAAAVQFLPPLGYLQEFSHRADRQETRETGKAWSATYSLNAEEIVSLAVPEFVGELTDTQQPPGARYWGRNPLKLNNEYAGLVPLLLLPVLLARRRTPQVWFFTGLGALTLLYALADSTPLFHLFYLIPGVNLFRAWSMIIFLYALSVAVLGAIAVQQLLEWLAAERSAEERASARRILWIVAAVFLGLALLQAAGVITSMWAALAGDAVRLDRLHANVPYITTGFWIAAVIALTVAGTWELAVRDVVTPAMVVLLLALVAGLDSYRASRPFVVHTALINRFQDGAPQFRADDTILLLQRLQDGGDPFRVFDLAPLLGAQGGYGQNDLAVHGLEQLAGHHGNELGRYRALIGGEHAANLGASELRLADVTNTAYFLAPGRIEHPKLEELHIGTQSVLYRNRDALARAYVVGRTELFPDGDDVVTRMLDPRFDAGSTAILTAPLPAGVQVEEGARGVVRWVERQVDRYTLDVTATAPGLLMVLDNWYPAWAAEVNGQTAPILRANHTFRAIPVPAGQSTVTLRYTPSALQAGAGISLAAMLLLLATVIAGVVLERRRPPGDVIISGRPGDPGVVEVHGERGTAGAGGMSPDAQAVQRGGVRRPDGS